jgi:glycosyltransferase involved in cell wall biosynthesis
MHVLSLVTTREARFYRQQVRSLEDRGVAVTTLAVPGRRRARDEDARTPLDYLRFVRQVRRRIDDSFDLVHANYGLTAPAALAQRQLPVVVSLWGSDLMGRFGPVSRVCARFADATIVMSEGMAAELDGDPYVVPHGVDLDRFRPIPARDARREIGWSDGPAHVLFPYSPEREVKNYPRAERVVAAVRDRLDRPVELHSVTGEPHDRMPLYYSAADALLLTSKREGSPNAVKEAMACNCPVVSTDVGDVRERLDGVAHSHVARTDRDLATVLAAVLSADEPSDGRDHLHDLDADRVGERIHTVYRSVLDCDGGASADTHEPNLAAN